MKTKIQIISDDVEGKISDLNEHLNPHGLKASIISKGDKEDCVYVEISKWSEVKHYVEFITPGGFICDTSPIEVPHREFEPCLPLSTKGYRFFDLEEIVYNRRECFRKNVSKPIYPKYE